MRYVKVEWVDSYKENGWEYADKFTKKPAECKTIGIEIENTKDYICIAQSISNSEHVSDVITIPKGAVKNVRELK